MATSPGRAAPQTKPAASTVTASRNRTTRIIAPSPWPECARRVGGELTGGRKRVLPRLCPHHPNARRRARRIGELAEIAKRGRNVGFGGVYLEAGPHRGSIVAGWRVNRTNAHQLAGIGLQPFEEVAFRRLRARN